MLKWLFRIISIIVILVCVLFLIKFFDFSDYYDVSSGISGNVDIYLLVIAAAAAVVAAIWCIFSKPAADKKAAVIKGIIFSLTIAVTIMNIYVYYEYLPKYVQSEACTIVKADYGFSDVDYDHNEGNPGGLLWYDIKNNPYESIGFILDWESDEGKTGQVFFDPAGKYQITFSDGFIVETECFTSAGKDNIFIAPGGTVEMNLYFNREQKNALVEKYAANGTWSEKTEIDFNTYQPCLSAEDVKAFILEMGESELLRQLEEGVNKYIQHYDEAKTASMHAASDLIVELKLYRVDIGTYQNGSIILK